MNAQSIWPTICAYASAAATTAAGVLHSTNPVALAGLAFAAGTFFVNWHYKRKQMQISKEMRDDYLRRHAADTKPIPLNME